VAKRYSPFFDNLDVLALNSPMAGHVYYLFDGVRNQTKV
jgi:hypothetical protein